MILRDPRTGLGGCPTREDLRRFALGRLPDSDSEEVARHIQGCPACSGFLDDLDDGDDPLVRGLRRGADAGRAPVDAPPGPSAGGGRYRVLRHHADGGLGRVWVALDAELGREVALKQIRDRYVDHPAVRARFEREATLLGQLEHPGIVPVHGLDRDAEGRPSYAMRLIHGRTLAEAIRVHHGQAAAGPGEPPATLDDLIRRFLDVCQTMAYAHSRGVIHRDLKPSNVMLGRYGETLVIDWGLAKVLGRPGPEPESIGERNGPTRPPSPGPLTGEGGVLGTPRYMSPEQARGSGEVDRRSDVFGLGAILCEILTGRPPARSEPADDRALLDAQGVDPELIALARSCLRPDPADRPRDASAVADALAAHLASVQDRLRAAEIARARAAVRRRAALVVAGSILLALLVGGSTFLERLRRADQARGAVQEAMDLAERTSDEARRSSGASRWDRANEAVKDARKTLDDRKVDLDRGEAAGFERRLGRLEVVVPNRASRARNVAKLSDELDEARIQAAGNLDFFNGQAIRAAYAKVFRDAGIDLDREPIGELDDSFRRDGDPARIASVLDDLASGGGPGSRPDTIARSIDPARNALRDALRRGDRDELLRWANSDAARELPGPGTLSLALALNRLGVAREDLVKLLTRALLRSPEDFWLNYNLSTLLNGEERVHFLRIAVALKPRSAGLLVNLGTALGVMGRLDEAEDAFRRAMELDPKLAMARANLAGILNEAGRIAEGEALAREVVGIDPDLVVGRINLGGVLLKQGKYSEAILHYRRAQAIDAAMPGSPYASRCAEGLAACEAALKLGDRLPRLARGEEEPRDVGERHLVAFDCYVRRRFAAASRLWAKAVEEKPELADVRGPQFRYNAASSAVRAATRGNEADGQAPASLRGQASAWLRADLRDWEALLRGGRPEDKAATAETLSHWKADPDLDGVRGDELDRLPFEEAADWARIWSEVDALIRLANRP